MLHTAFCAHTRHIRCNPTRNGEVRGRGAGEKQKLRAEAILYTVRCKHTPRTRWLPPAHSSHLKHRVLTQPQSHQGVSLLRVEEQAL